MKKIVSLPLALILNLMLSVTAFAQGGAPAACGCMAGMVIVYLLFIAAIFAIFITVIVLIFKYIKKDAIARGMPNANSVCWLALLGLLGLLIYVLTRPQGNILPCPHCGKGRMQGLPRCPNCGNT
jgi:uncharacterized oligopeptide transporter (OPT) family protein